MRIVKAGSPGAVDDAARELSACNAVVYPTDTLYGLGVDATRDECVEKIFSIKGRDFSKPVSVAVADFSMLEGFARMGKPQLALAKALLPGPFTLVLPAEGLAGNLASGNVGFRIPASDFARKMIGKFGRPVTATSANVSGSAAGSIAAASRQLGARVALYVDAGPLKGEASTVIDCAGFKVLRKGAGLARAEAAMRQAALF